MPIHSTYILGNFYKRQVMNKILRSAIVGVSATAIATLGASAQAVTLINGNFTPTTGQTKSSFFSDAITSNWTVGQGATSGKLAFVAPFGGSAPTDLNASGLSRPSGIWVLQGSTPILSPDGIAQWFVGSDGDSNYNTPISQTVTGLTAGEKYDVTFYQSAGQQQGLTGPTTERWQVSLGSAPSQLSTLMSFPDTANGVKPWTKQTLRFTADNTSDVLSFLAVGTPGGAPPFSLLSSVSVNVVATPEPLTIIGTIVGGTAAFRLRKKLAKSTKNA